MEIPDEKPFVRAPWNWIDTVLIIFFACIFGALFFGGLQVGD